LRRRVRDAQHRIFALKQLFRGTVSQTSLYPRVVEPGRRVPDADAEALALVDVRVLDHLVVAGADVCSIAERGLV
jgi:DNA repair protein RadC